MWGEHCHTQTVQRDVQGPSFCTVLQRWWLQTAGGCLHVMELIRQRQGLLNYTWNVFIVSYFTLYILSTPWKVTKLTYSNMCFRDCTKMISRGGRVSSFRFLLKGGGQSELFRESRAVYFRFCSFQIYIKCNSSLVRFPVKKYIKRWDLHEKMSSEEGLTCAETYKSMSRRCLSHQKKIKSS